jgi:hypothetical protein
MEMWENKNKEIIDEQTRIQEQISKLKGDEAKYFELFLNILDLAHRSREIYEKHKNPEDRRLLLSHIFSNLVITDGNVAYTLKKPVQILADRIKQHIDDKKIFEPQKTLAIKRQKDSFESLSPALLRRQGSNLRPIAYVSSTITNGTDYIIFISFVCIVAVRSEGLRGLN